MSHESTSEVRTIRCVTVVKAWRCCYCCCDAGDDDARCYVVTTCHMHMTRATRAINNLTLAATLNMPTSHICRCQLSYRSSELHHHRLRHSSSRMSGEIERPVPGGVLHLACWRSAYNTRYNTRSRHSTSLQKWCTDTKFTWRSCWEMYNIVRRQQTVGTKN